jgi:hypothetical protein
MAQGILSENKIFFLDPNTMRFARKRNQRETVRAGGLAQNFAASYPNGRFLDSKRPAVIHYNGTSPPERQNVLIRRMHHDGISFW